MQLEEKVKGSWVSPRFPQSTGAEYQLVTLEPDDSVGHLESHRVFLSPCPWVLACICDMASVGKANPFVRDSTSGRERFWRSKGELRAFVCNIRKLSYWVGPARLHSTLLGKSCLQFGPTYHRLSTPLVLGSCKFPVG